MKEEFLYNANETMKMLGKLSPMEFTTSKQVKDVIKAHQKDNEDISLYNTMLVFFIPLLADIYNLGKLSNLEE